MTGIPEVDKLIREYRRLLKSLPRSNYTRPIYLLQVASLQSQRWRLSGQKSDLDKAITHSTEAILLSPTPSRHIVVALYHLATLLISRYTDYNQHNQPGCPCDDLKSSIEHLRFLRINFHSLKAFPEAQASGGIPPHLFRALAFNLKFIDDESAQDLEEIVTLIPEFITADILTSGRKSAFEAFGLAAPAPALVSKMCSQEDTERVVDRAIEVLRKATVLNPDLAITFALAMYLAVRFQARHDVNDSEEAITNFDRVVATCSPGNNVTTVESEAMRTTSTLLVSRMYWSPTPENLEDGIRRLRAIVPYSLDDKDRTQLTDDLHTLTHMRFQFFGVTGHSGEAPPDPYLEIIPTSYIIRRSESEIWSRTQEKMDRLTDLTYAILNGKITDVEAAVEGSRKLIHSRHSTDQWSPSSDLVYGFASVLLHAFGRTKRLDYLNEAITTYQDLRKIPGASKLTQFAMGWKLSTSFIERLKLLRRPQDLDESIQLSSELVNDGSGDVFTRFAISCLWSTFARVHLHPSASLAHETAMSLLQESLCFCPTLQTQHHRLADVFRRMGCFPLDYASYWIENGQVKQAIETLERGRSLIWSEMRGLRTSTDQLRAADPALADKFSNINKALELVTMSVAQSDEDEIGRGKTGTGLRERSIGHLVLKQRKLLEERNSLISHIQSLSGLENFLKPLSFDVLNSAAACGPVIIINLASPDFPSYIILLVKGAPPSIISTPSSFRNHAIQLETELLSVREEKGLDSIDYSLALASVLSGLYELVGKPVIERLRELKVPEKSRVWLCPTDVFCSLPLHAMGPIPSDDGEVLYFSDLYIPSYTPTLSALIESRQRGSLSDAPDNSKPSILLVAQPDTLPGAFGEIKAVEAAKTTVKTLISAMATPKTVIEGLRNHRFAHFVCHGSLEAGKPFEASLALHKDNLTLLAIVRSQLPAAEFAFLAACHTAELTLGSIADEALHLAAAMQYCGFRSVVGTMWAMADTDGADLSKHFYQAIFADKADQNGVRYHQRSARALQVAVKKLRKKRGMTLERWVNFVHYGA